MWLFDCFNTLKFNILDKRVWNMAVEKFKAEYLKLVVNQASHGRSFVNASILTHDLDNEIYSYKLTIQ